MKYLAVILILILGSCSVEPESKSIDPNCGYEMDGYYAPESDPMFQFEWVGDWRQMTIEENGKTGRYPLNKDFTDTARYTFYGHGIDVMTEVSPNHSGYQVVIDGVLIEEVITYVDSEMGTDVKTFSTSCLTVGNHVLELVRLNDIAPFVINGLQINFYIDPILQGWNPCFDECLPCDSIPQKPLWPYFLDDFEDGILHLDPWWHALGDGTEIVKTDPTNSGNKVLEERLEIKKYPSNGPARAQIEYNPASPPLVPRYFPWFTTHGISFKMYVPANWTPGVVEQLFWQLHVHAGSPLWGPSGVVGPCYLKIVGDKIRFTTKTSPIEDVDGVVTKYYQNIATIQPGNWYYWVINTHYDYRAGNTNGFHKVYLGINRPPTESDIIVNHIGPTGMNDVTNNEDWTAYPTWSVYMGHLKYQNRVEDELAAISPRTHVTYLYDNIYIQDGAISFGPIEPPCIPDTIYIEVPGETIYLQPKIYVVADSTIYEIE